jgi:TfoX/Sxy family transcriptional regulator of competence genes
MAGLGLRPADGPTLETKHFFSGAALYANGKICATLSPAGFALKLPPDKRQSLIQEGEGKEFRFFPNGPIKREYVAVSASIIRDEETLRPLIGMSVSYVVGAPESE